jgi:hypothetical protein
MRHLFQKIAAGVTLPWDIRSLELQFTTTHVNEKADDQPWHHPLGYPHWQKYMTGIQFARNFYSNFENQALLALDIVKVLQESCKAINLSDDRDVRVQFRRYKLDPRRIGVIKIDGGVNVVPHVDITRDLALNIALRRGNTGTTTMWDTGAPDMTQYVDHQSFTMEDGEAYLLSVDHVHEVRSHTVFGDDARYVLTYTMGASDYE